MRNFIFLASALGILGTLASQAPPLIGVNPVDENTDGYWTSGTYPTTGRRQMPSTANHPNYTNGTGVSGDTWIYRVFYKRYQHIGDATAAPAGDKSRITGFDCLMQPSPSTASGTTIAVNLPDIMVTGLNITPATSTSAASVRPDLTNRLFEATHGNATVTLASGTAVYNVGVTYVDANQATTVVASLDLTDYALCAKYSAGSARAVPATATTPSQGFAQDVESGYEYPPVDPMNPPSPVVPFIGTGYFGWDGMTQTQAFTDYVDFDSRPFLNLDLDNPTLTFVADFGYSTLYLAPGSVEGTGTCKHYPFLSTNASAGFETRVYAEQFAGGVAVPFWNASLSYFNGAVYLPFALGNPGKQMTIELLPADPVFSSLSGFVTLDANLDGVFDVANVPLPGTPNPIFIGLIINVECVLATLNPTDDRWDSTGATAFRVY